VYKRQVPYEGAGLALPPFIDRFCGAGLETARFPPPRADECPIRWANNISGVKNISADRIKINDSLYFVSFFIVFIVY
jgi:hypothetical protein